MCEITKEQVFEAVSTVIDPEVQSSRDGSNI